VSFNGLQHLFRVYAVVRYGDGRDHRRLPGIEMIDLGDRNVETLTQAVFQAFDHVALLFQRVRFFDSDFERGMLGLESALASVPGERYPLHVNEDASPALETLRQTLFKPGNLTQPYHSVNVDVNKRIAYLD